MCITFISNSFKIGGFESESCVSLQLSSLSSTRVNSIASGSKGVFSNHLKTHLKMIMLVLWFRFTMWVNPYGLVPKYNDCSSSNFSIGYFLCAMSAETCFKILLVNA